MATIEREVKGSNNRWLCLGHVYVQGGKVYMRWEETVEYLRDYMMKNGPYDGVVGFSQVFGTVYEYANSIQCVHSRITTL